MFIRKCLYNTMFSKCCKMFIFGCNWYVSSTSIPIHDMFAPCTMSILDSLYCRSCRFFSQMKITLIHKQLSLLSDERGKVLGLILKRNC